MISRKTLLYILLATVVACISAVIILLVANGSKTYIITDTNQRPSYNTSKRSIECLKADHDSAQVVAQLNDVQDKINTYNLQATKENYSAASDKEFYANRPAQRKVYDDTVHAYDAQWLQLYDQLTAIKTADKCFE